MLSLGWIVWNQWLNEWKCSYTMSSTLHIFTFTLTPQIESENKNRMKPCINFEKKELQLKSNDRKTPSIVCYSYKVSLFKLVNSKESSLGLNTIMYNSLTIFLIFLREMKRRRKTCTQLKRIILLFKWSFSISRSWWKT